MPATIGKPGRVAVLLSFVAGFVDTVGFVALFGLFTAHVTGNLVLIGAALVRSHAGFIAKLAALPVFILIVAAVTWYVDARERSGRRPLQGLLIAQILLLAGFAMAGIAAEPIVSADSPLAILAGLLGVAAMGIQNASSRLLMNDLPPTTVMTGGVTQFAIDATQLLLGSSSQDQSAARKRLARFAPPVAAFAFGAVAGALTYTTIRFAALLAPIAALLAVVVLTRAPGTVPTAGAST